MALNNNKMPIEEGKTLNANHTAYSYDEVFPALKVDMTPKNHKGPEHMPPAVPPSVQRNKMRMTTSEITTVRAVDSNTSTTNLSSTSTRNIACFRFLGVIGAGGGAEVRSQRQVRRGRVDARVHSDQ